MFVGMITLYVTLIVASVVVMMLNRSTCLPATSRPRDTYSKSLDSINRAKHESAPEHPKEVG